MLFLTLGCASVMNPEGGDKDVTPPRVVKSQPDSAALNSFSKKIVLTFDEYIAVQNPTKEWVISPSPEKFPEYKIKGKSLEINLIDSIRPATTYAFNFGKSIADINEGNILKDYRFIFSTDTFIDSLEISGQILDAKTAEPKKEMVVFLRETDTLLTHAKILYRVSTDETGKFRFQNLANRSYQIMALEDKNNNKQIEKDEAIAFLTQPIVPDSAALILYSFMPALGKQYLTSSYSTIPGIYHFIFHQPLYQQPVQISAADPGFRYSRKTHPGQDTITLYSEVFRDSVSNRFNIQTSDTQYIQTIKNPPVADSLLRTQFQLTEQNAVFNFSQPIQKIQYTQLQFWKDSLRLPIDSSSFSISHHQLIFRYPLEEGISYQLLLPSGSVLSVYNKKTTRNDTLTFKKPQLNKTGSLQFVIQDTTKRSFTLELIKDFKTVQSVHCQGCASIQFNNIPPDSYQLRALLDSNQNNIFETGSLSPLTLPEHSIILPNTYKVKPDWHQTDIPLSIPSSTSSSTTR